MNQQKKENDEYQIENEVRELKITYATDLDGDPPEIAKIFACSAQNESGNDTCDNNLEPGGLYSG